MSLLSLSIVFLLQITIIFCQTPIPYRPRGYIIIFIVVNNNSLIVYIGYPYLPCSTNPKVVIEAVYDQ